MSLRKHRVAIGTETKREVWLLRTGFGIAPANKLVSLTWLLWALRSFRSFTLHYITLHNRSNSSESPLSVCPIRLFSLFLIVCIRDLSSPIIASTSSFVVCSVQFIFSIIRYNCTSKASSPFVSIPLNHVSDPYSTIILHISVLSLAFFSAASIWFEIWGGVVDPGQKISIFPCKFQYILIFFMQFHKKIR